MKKRKNNEVKEYRKPTDAPLFIIYAQIYSYNGINLPCCIPLTDYNNLQLINIRFESTHNHPEISFASQINSCTAMNVGNLIIHQWVIITQP